MRREKPIIYVVQQIPDGPCKIGISKDPVKHIKRIQEENPNEIKLELMINPGTLSAKTLAKRVCEKLSNFRVRGDWFGGISITTIEETIISEREGFEKQSSSNWDTLFNNEEDLRNMRDTIKILHAHTNFNYIIDPKRNKIIPSSLRNKKYVKKYSDCDMKSRIIKHIEDTTRYDVSISKDVELVLWIIEQTNTYNPLPFKERVYSALHGVSPICTYGKKKKFRTFKEGYSKCHLVMCRCKLEENRSMTAEILYPT